MKVALEREFVGLAFLAEFLRNIVEKQISLGREVTIAWCQASPVLFWLSSPWGLTEDVKFIL